MKGTYAATQKEVAQLESEHAALAEAISRLDEESAAAEESGELQLSKQQRDEYNRLKQEGLISPTSLELLPYLPISPYTSFYISLYLPISPPVTPCISLHLLLYLGSSRRRAAGRPRTGRRCTRSSAS